MKGTDITEEQIRHAEEFVMNSATRGYDGDIVTIRKADLFRLVAWYGAVRAASGNAPEDLGPISRRDDGDVQPQDTAPTQMSRAADGGFHSTEKEPR